MEQGWGLSMKNRLYAGAAASALLISISTGAAFAQQAPQRNADGEIVLEPIVIERNRGASQGPSPGEGRNEQPVVATEAVTVLTTRVERDTMEAQQVTNVRDIDRLSPGVSYSESSRSFNIRGLDRTRVLTTVDGIRLPWFDDGARGVQGGIASFDFDTLSSLDIVKGSDSSIFGSGGLGGVIALRTLDPEDLIQPGNSWGGLTKSTFDSRDDSWSANQAVAARVDNTWVLVQSGYRQGHEIENEGGNDIDGPTRTDKNPADYDQENVLAKVHHYVDGNHMFGLTGEIFNRDEDIDLRTASTTTYIPGTSTNEEIVKRQRVSANYEYEGDGLVDAAQAIVYWQRQQLETNSYAVRRPTNALPGVMTRDNEREAEIFGINGSLLKAFETGSVLHAVSFGGELFGSRDQQYSSGDDRCDEITPTPSSCASLRTNQSDMPDVGGVTFGAFVQDEIALLNGQLRITPGLRVDAYDYSPKLDAEFARNPVYLDYGLPDASNDAGVSGKLRAEFDPANQITLFAQWAQGFRAPTPTELYLNYGGSGGVPGSYIAIGDPNLKTETSNGFEVGALLGDKLAGGSVNLFYNRYKNFIDQYTGSPEEFGFPSGEYMFVQKSLNRANVEIYGAEATAHYYDPSGWHGWTTVGAYVGEDMDLDVGLNTIPAARIMLGVGYAADQWGADAIFTGVARRDFKGSGPALPLPGSDVETLNSATPAYALVDLTAWYSPAAFEGLTIRAGIYNLFDETYFKTLDLASSIQNKDYYTEPGRTFKVSATYQF